MIKKVSHAHAYILVAVLAVVVSVALIYLTPLKWFNLVPPTIREVDPTSFQREFEADPGEYIFIDVRSSDVYSQMHAKGSISMPIGVFPDEYMRLPRSDKTIVLICSSGKLAKAAYGYLQYQGFTNLLHIDGGLQNWVLEKQPVEGNDLNAPIPVSD